MIPRIGPAEEGGTMALLTVEGVYKDGKVELAERPAGVVETARVLVIFLPENFQLRPTVEQVEVKQSPRQ